MRAESRNTSEAQAESGTGAGANADAEEILSSVAELVASLPSRLPPRLPPRRPPPGYVKRALELAYTADRCFKCDRPTPEIVYRVRTYVAPAITGGVGHQSMLLPYCYACTPEHLQEDPRVRPALCERCRKIVLDTERPAHRRYVACGSRCREDIYQARRAKGRIVKIDPRSCDTCATTFTPLRADGRFCSNACRQAAYRHRQEEKG